MLAEKISRARPSVTRKLSYEHSANHPRNSSQSAGGANGKSAASPSQRGDESEAGHPLFSALHRETAKDIDPVQAKSGTPFNFYNVNGPPDSDGLNRLTDHGRASAHLKPFKTAFSQFAKIHKGPSVQFKAEPRQGSPKERSVDRFVPSESGKQYDISKNSPVTQLKNADQLGIAGGYVEENTTAAIYNSSLVGQGNTYSKTIQINQNGRKAVNTAYTAEARVMGTATSAHTYLDAKAFGEVLPSEDAWKTDKGKKSFTSAMSGFFTDKKTFNGWIKNAGDRDAVGKLLTPPREDARNMDEIKYLDPFVSRLTIKSKDDSEFVYETTYANAANAYITAMEDPEVGRRSEIRRVQEKADDAVKKAASFEDQKDDAVGAGPYIYSAGHVQGDGTLEENIAHQGANDTKSKYHKRMDAITQIGAEGARFVPVETAGTQLKWTSRFYATLKKEQEKDAHGNDVDKAGDHFTKSMYYEFGGLANKWGKWFDRKFGITAATMITEIDKDNRGKIDAKRGPLPGVDFLLTKDRFAKDDDFK